MWDDFLVRRKNKSEESTLSRYLFTVTTFSKLLAMFLFITLPFVGFYLGTQYQKTMTMVEGQKDIYTKTVIFKCNKAKSITATFYINEDKYVDLILSDGRKLSLPRAMSASGARYAKADESFVFWNKGETAFITEKDKMTFENCSYGN